MKFYKNKAFTLVESMLVMVILATSLAGATYLMITVTNSIAENRQRIQATYLAQECMELTRNARDSAWKQNLDWDCPFYPVGLSLTAGELRISEDPVIRAGNASTNCMNDLGISLDNNTDFRLKKRTDKLTDYSGTEGDTLYERKLIISDIVDDGATPSITESAKFTCEVMWVNRGNSQKVGMSQILTDWKK